MMKVTDFENKVFTKGLRGYDCQDVDNYVKELLDYCRSLEHHKKIMQEKIMSHNKQEQLITEALISAQQTASVIKSEAEKTAKTIKIQAEREAMELIKSTELETQAYRDNIYKYYYSYERELRLIIDHFYSLARKHMDHLQKELTNEIQSVVSRFDDEYNNLPKLDISLNPNEASKPKENQALNRLKETEFSLLLGRTINRDIINPQGIVLIKKDTVITPDVITNCIRKGLYGELIAAAEYKED